MSKITKEIEAKLRAVFSLVGDSVLEGLSEEIAAIDPWTKPDSSLQQYMDAHAEWADVTFKGQSLKGVLAHLKKEIAEWKDAPEDPEEFADCFSLMMRAWRLLGGTADTAIETAYQKLDVCKGREYGEPDEDGSVQHIPHPKEPTRE